MVEGKAINNLGDASVRAAEVVGGSSTTRQSKELEEGGSIVSFINKELGPTA